MRLLTGLAALAVFAGATTANAAATFTFNGGAGVQPGETVFATFDGGPSTYGGITGSYIVQSGSNGNGADPAVLPMGDPYLSVLGGQSASYNFGPSGLQQLGLDYGSADPYNTFILSFVTGPNQTFTGSDIVAGADGNQTQARTNGRLTFRSIAGNGITGITLQSSQNSLEADNFASIGAVPEPSTWAMMLVGFGAIGVGMRRSRKTSAVRQLA